MGVIRDWQDTDVLDIQPPGVREQDKNYYSAEFQLQTPKISYQFRIRQNDWEPMFALVKPGSRALECLRQGDILPMTYYFQNRGIPAEKKLTRIKYIVEGKPLGYQGHYVIGLSV